MKKLKENQNAILEIEICVGKLYGVPIHKTVKVVSTMLQVSVYMGSRLLGVAGVIRAKDFDFETLYKLALRDCTKNIIKEVA